MQQGALVNPAMGFPSPQGAFNHQTSLLMLMKYWETKVL